MELTLTIFGHELHVGLSKLPTFAADAFAVAGTVPPSTVDAVHIGLADEDDDDEPLGVGFGTGASHVRNK